MPAVTVMPSISVYVVLHDFKQNNKKKIVSILLQVVFFKKTYVNSFKYELSPWL